MYNLLSDKLDKFEREVRKVRNQIVAKFIFFFVKSTRYIFLKFKPYIHTENVKKFREIVQMMDVDCEKEVELRRKIQQSSKDFDMLLRDSSVLDQQTLRNALNNNRVSGNMQASASTAGIRAKIGQRIMESRQQVASQSDDAQSTISSSQLHKSSSSLYKRAPTRQQPSYDKSMTGGVQNTARAPMKIAKKKNDLNESVYSQYLEEEELYSEQASFDRKM